MERSTNTRKTIYELALHEKMWADSHIEVLRVPGGWLYTLFSSTNVTAFIPYNNEFMKSENTKQILRSREKPDFTDPDMGLGL